MKEIINYYYNLDISKIKDNNDYCSFCIFGNKYYFVCYNRTEEELSDLLSIIQELKYKGIKVHDILPNINGKYITTYNGINYVLLKTNVIEQDVVSFVDVEEFIRKVKLKTNLSKLYRINWSELWGKKVDYFEYQMAELGQNKVLLKETFNYYVGLAENAISYVNKITKSIRPSSNDSLALAHRRIFFPNIALNFYNPLSFVFDYEVRDIAEFIKNEFFNNEDALLDLITFLKMHKLSIFSYHMLYARLLYPSYYFDLYENIINKDESESILNPIISKINDYEVFLKKAYEEILKYCHIEKIDWLIKKEL